MTARKRAKTKRRPPHSLFDLAAQWREAKARYQRKPKDDDYDSDLINAADKIAFKALTLRATTREEVEIKRELLTELKDCDRPFHPLDSAFADLCIAYGAPLVSLYDPRLKLRGAGQDAKLLKLVPELNRLEEEWIAAQIPWVKEEAKLSAKLLAETGVPSGDAAWDLVKWEPVSAKAQKLHDQYFAARSRLLSQRPKQSAECEKRELKRWDRVRDAIDRLTNFALAERATTFAGARVQLRAFAMSNREAFDGALEEADERQTRLLLESLCSVLGVTAAPMRLRTEASVNAGQKTEKRRAA